MTLLQAHDFATYRRPCAYPTRCCPPHITSHHITHQITLMIENHHHTLIRIGIGARERANESERTENREGARARKS